nr:reverse transcriptase domain-containing protein [Tanacetum cinerariifolium]
IHSKGIILAYVDGVTRLDFREGPRGRVREDSYYSNTKARATEPGRVKIQDHLKYGSRHVLDRLGHRRQSAFDQLSETYSPSTTKSRPQRKDSRDSSRVRSRARTLSAPRDDRYKDKECLRGTRESVCFDELFPESINGYKDLRAAFMAYFMQQKKYIKDPVEIHNIKQRDGETIEDFMERCKIETGRMKEAPECMRIFGFMYGVNNPELTKRLNEHVPKTMEEMMITTTSFIRGEAAAASKKKGHASWKPQDQSKRHSSDKRPDFRGKLSHLIKEIKQGRDQSKARKKETTVKDKPTTIYMVQSWQRTVKQKVTQSFERVGEIAFPQLAAKIKNQMVPATTSLTGFSGEIIWPLGQLKLLVTIGDATHSTKAWMNFMIVRSMSPYNTIIERPGLKAIQAVPSTVHGMLKFPVERGIATIRSTLLIPTECESVTTSSVIPREEETRPANFTPSDMTGVPRSVAEHRLNIREGYSPERQKKRGQAHERAKAIQAEVQKLVEAGIMREVYYHDWLSNPVMVKKHDGSCRMCVDFTDLNKACPQDCYPLPEIDWKVESLCEYPFKCFLDAYKGYHQIQLAEADEEKMAFHTGQGVYCYTKMPFGLKNAGAAYQRLMDKAFEGHVGRNIEVYVDDLVIKSHTKAEMVRDVEETFRTLRKVNMKLNPKKCSFGLPEGVFLGGKISAAVSDHKKCIKKSDFRWTTKAEQAFQQLKQHLSELPLLVAPKPQKELIMYLSANYGAVNAVLMTERGTTQTPIYFISHTLLGPELNYSPMEKLVLSLFFAAKRLRRYFQAHPITVITDQPIKQVMTRPDVAGRLQKRSIMLGEHNITYRPRTSVKGQILADFLIEMPGDVSQAASAAVTQEEPWTLFTDGSSCVDGSGAGVILTNPEGVEFTYALRFQFAASINEAKYEALVAGLRIAMQMGVKNVQVLVEVLENKSIKEKEVAAVIEEDGPTWMTHIVDYLKEGVLPRDKKEARKLRLKARSLQADYVMRKIHEGSCSMHAGPSSVVAKSIQLGYYWPTMHKDARDMIRKCNDCQIHRPITRHPQQSLTPITALWRFYKWGINIAGPFLEGPGKVKFLMVAMDYFMKWIEAKAVATITGGQVKKFVWENIVCRFGIPGEIISDNGKQFADNPFKDWCGKLNITQRFASVKHPQSNGLVERANRSLGEGIKARLGEGNKNWVEELPHFIWAHRTMIKSSHVIPAEIGMPTYRTAAVDTVNDDEELRLNLDLLEERRERAAPGDFVYRSNDASHAVAGGKLGPKWEGPYEVTEALGNGAYKLRSIDGTVLPRTWNVTNLKRCYL